MFQVTHSESSEVKLENKRRKIKNLWRREKNNLKSESLTNGKVFGNNYLDQAVFQQVLKQIFSKLAVSTTFILAKVLSLDLSFKETNVQKICDQVYPFLSLQNLSCYMYGSNVEWPSTQSFVNIIKIVCKVLLLQRSSGCLTMNFWKYG